MWWASKLPPRLKQCWQRKSSLLKQAFLAFAHFLDALNFVLSLDAPVSCFLLWHERHRLFASLESSTPQTSHFFLGFRIAHFLQNVLPTQIEVPQDAQVGPFFGRPSFDVAALDPHELQ